MLSNFHTLHILHQSLLQTLHYYAKCTIKKTQTMVIQNCYVGMEGRIDGPMDSFSVFSCFSAFFYSFLFLSSFPFLSWRASSLSNILHDIVPLRPSAKKKEKVRLQCKWLRRLRASVLRRVKGFHQQAWKRARGTDGCVKPFLVACTRLYTLPCRSVRLSVCPSVGPSHF